MGTPADAETRRARMDAHRAFDRIWKSVPAGKGRSRARREAYRWLAGQLGIETDACHIGMFDLGTCKQVVEICEKRETGAGMNNQQLREAYRADDVVIRSVAYAYQCREARRRHLRHMAEQFFDGVFLGVGFWVTWRVLSVVWGILT